MLKTILKIGGGLLMFLLLFGCGKDPSKDIEGTEKIADIPFERVQLEDTPKDVQETINYKNREKATYVLPSDNDYYIVVSRGEQPTGGYDVEITSVEDWGDSVHVFYKFKDPADDELVTQAITFPLEIVKIERTDKTILFKLIEHENKRNKGIDINL